MRRIIACLGLLLLLSGPVRAGELDDDFAAKVPPAVAKVTAEDGPAISVAATELDAESPAQSFFFGRRWGWGGLGWGGLGWGGWGGYGCGGWGGWGWSPVVYSTAFVSPGLGWGYGGWGYGGWGCW